MTIRRTVALLISLVVAMGASIGLSTSANAAVSCNSRGSQISAVGVLQVGECLVSENGKYKLVMQGDGNLVLYANSNNRACWASNTSSAGDKAYFFVASFPGYREAKLRVQASQGSTFAHYQVTYSDPYASPGDPTLSINNSGQVYVGYKKHVSC